MALLTLRDIGKIYVSEGNVTVGIRGVNLSFDRGEFVAITGKSGSGKSTLLNVISGMDSYEEGELLIEGQPTSHYLQPDWELYREKYISFIFQDYNIIDSFTVLQNVELALMDMEDPRARRRRALELIDRVGLSSHIRQKGSKLSGGQKQRTVIARALAKDSPIILADEPTGNLDSATSREIIELLREVSKDKLLIVVTHNFEEVEAYATRHIRVFDGSVESDHVVRHADIRTEPVGKSDEKDSKHEKRRHFRNGWILGRTVFTAKPKLTIFLCFLMILGTLGVFLVTAFYGDAANLFKPNEMFRHIDGRVIVTTQSGAVLSKEQIDGLVAKYGAKDHLRVDLLLDSGEDFPAQIYRLDNPKEWEGISFLYTYGETFGDRIIGRYPEAANEVFLYLPISYQPLLGEDGSRVRFILLDTRFDICGIKYYYDNNLHPKCLMTKEGFETLTALFNLNNGGWSEAAEVVLTDSYGKFADSVRISEKHISFDLEPGKVYTNYTEGDGSASYQHSMKFTSSFYRYDYSGATVSNKITFSKSFSDNDFARKTPADVEQMRGERDFAEYYIAFSDEAVRDLVAEILDQSYRQVSLFFENDKEAHRAAEKMRADGYVAVPSDTEYEQNALTAILGVIVAVMSAFLWVISVIFLSFLISLCMGRTLGAFKGELAIMRSMGIPTKVIRISLYVRMLLSLIPAFVLLAVTATVLFVTPKLNGFFVFLYPWQYAAIVLGMVILTLRITAKQMRKLFGVSVKKSLKGGAAE